MKKSLFEQERCNIEKVLAKECEKYGIHYWDVSFRPEACEYELRFRKQDYWISYKINADVFHNSAGSFEKQVQEFVKTSAKKIDFKLEQRERELRKEQSHQEDAIRYIIEDYNNDKPVKYLDDKDERPPKEPSFTKYTEKFPLGPPGHFYNSRHQMKKISKMRTSYLKSTMDWMQRTWGKDDGTKGEKFVVDKYHELLEEYTNR